MKKRNWGKILSVFFVLIALSISGCIGGGGGGGTDSTVASQVPTLQMGTISGKLAGEQKAGLTVIAEQVLGGQAASVRYASSKK
ncbi:MAG: hypothetical protein PHQ23_16070, partial [Candidatus Wallbacteria bacterium]|nr:hypothetical protein [Candidatus Wallbacteria bacterium]